MGQLVAEAPGGHAGALHLKLLPVPVKGPHLHPLGALHIAPHTGDGQAALQAVLLPLLGHDLRVYQLHGLKILVHDDDGPAEDAHLGGRQTGPVGVLQRLLQVVQQIPQLLVKLGHRVADLRQRRLPLR